MSDELPEGWAAAKLETLIESSFYGPRFSSEDYMPSGVPTIRTTDMDMRGRISLKEAPRVTLDADGLKKFGLIDGDLLVTRTGTIGRCALYTDDIGPAIPSAYLIRFRLKREAIDSRLALLFLQSPLGQSQLGLGITAVAQPNINAKAIGAFDIPLAPLPEQRRIVEKVEALLEQVNRAKERLDRVPLILKRFRQAVLAAACSGELTREWRKTRSSSDNNEGLLSNIDMSSLPEIPSSWRWRRLPELGELNRGKSRHRPRNDPKLYGGPYPFLQTGDVANSRGRITSHKQTYSEAGLAQSRLWPARTVCITIAANIADSAMLTYPACFPDSVVGLITDPTIAVPAYAEFFIPSYSRPEWCPPPAEP
jgi:type I restriction enzyme S subunit